ncbi:MAG: UDP-N-acetylglucosamine 1-carboxyvinyltransferase [Firmicutes bacterium]|jgi:UDP-N-acetylglucosamine 1-carboxyvinyltransferase|nr:UDP-N-acetylglucosamine 1-carboxyvinyltransferase [Bacillota bacterium]
MAHLIIRGGNPLYGEISVSGSKNSAMPILTAAALSDEESIIDNVPRDTSVLTICLILRSLGAEVYMDDKGRIHVRGAGINNHSAPYDLVRRERGSFYTAGLLLGRLGCAEVPLPGGCAIGSRPVDFHIRGFQQLGAEVTIEHGYVKASAPQLRGTSIFINRSSVGTTINLMIAAAKAEGVTILENAAKEPEVVDLAIFLNSMGARVRGAGTDVIRIEGVKELYGTEYGIICDRIEAGTYLMCAAVAGGEVLLKDVVPEHLRSPILKLMEAGVEIKEDNSSILVRSQRKLKACDVETAPYPGFPTDLQQPFVALMSTAEGTSVIRETIFDRFRYVDELRRMGADIRVEHDTAIVRGVEQLSGAPVEATDLRAGAALVVAALGAVGETRILGLEILDRGYEGLSEKLHALGADVVREESPDSVSQKITFAALRLSKEVDQDG